MEENMDTLIGIILFVLLSITGWRLCKGSSRHQDDK